MPNIYNTESQNYIYSSFEWEGGVGEQIIGKLNINCMYTVYKTLINWSVAFATATEVLSDLLNLHFFFLYLILTMAGQKYS